MKEIVFPTDLEDPSVVEEAVERNNAIRNDTDPGAYVGECTSTDNKAQRLVSVSEYIREDVGLPHGEDNMDVDQVRIRPT